MTINNSMSLEEQLAALIAENEALKASRSNLPAPAITVKYKADKGVFSLTAPGYGRNFWFAAEDTDRIVMALNAITESQLLTAQADRAAWLALPKEVRAAHDAEVQAVYQAKRTKK
jgi:hypothetical protein